MMATIWSAVVIAAASSAFIPEGATPAGTFACSMISSAEFNGNMDDLISSTIGEITLDGNGSYTQADGGAGTVAWGRGALRFTTGELSGTVALVEHDNKGRRFLHIDGTVMNVPAGPPKFGDHICLEK